jgi:hypothetical protein
MMCAEPTVIFISIAISLIVIRRFSHMRSSVNCHNHFRCYDTMCLSRPWRFFNTLYPVLKLLDPLVDLRFTRTWWAIFGQHSCINFHWFGTFYIEKLDHRLHLLFGAQLQGSLHLHQLIISVSATRWLCVPARCCQWTSTSNMKHSYHGLFHITNFIQFFQLSFEWPLYIKYTRDPVFNILCFTCYSD